MKRFTALSVFIFFIISFSFGQRRTITIGYSSNDRYDDSYRYDNDYRYNYRDGNRDRYNSVYRRDHQVYARMNQSDRRSLRRLEKKIRERERCAWEDGFVTEREARRINSVLRDIDKLNDRYYSRQGRRYNDNRGRYDNNRNQSRRCP